MVALVREEDVQGCVALLRDRFYAQEAPEALSDLSSVCFTSLSGPGATVYTKE